MSCCGQRRSNFTIRPVAHSAVANTKRSMSRPSAPTSPSTAPGMVALRSVASGGMVVRGPATGQQYAFSASAPVQIVDARDAGALLRTSWFRQA
jgi:hypothetical protein